MTLSFVFSRLAQFNKNYCLSIVIQIQTVQLAFDLSLFKNYLMELRYARFYTVLMTTESSQEVFSPLSNKKGGVTFLLTVEVFDPQFPRSYNTPSARVDRVNQSRAEQNYETNNLLILLPINPEFDKKHRYLFTSWICHAKSIVKRDTCTNPG
jgi:hypothetical protein